MSSDYQQNQQAQQQQQQNNLVNVAQTLSDNQPISNQQISQVINSTQDFIEFEKAHDPHLSGPLLKTVSDFQDVLQAADQLNQNKNADEKIQTIFSESAAAAQEAAGSISQQDLQTKKDQLQQKLQSQDIQQKTQDIKEKGKEVGQSILSFLKLMISSGEFRNYIDSFLDSVQEWFYNNSEFGGEQTKTQIQNQVQDEQLQLQQRTQQPTTSLSESQKHELSHKFLNLLRSIKQNESFKTGIRDLMNLFSDLKDEAKDAVQQDVFPQLQDTLNSNKHIYTAAIEAKNLIENFTQRPVDPFIYKVKGLFLYIRDNEKPRQWFDEFTSLLNQTIEKPESLDEYEFTQRVEQLIDHAYALTQDTQFKAKYTHVFSELRVIALAIKEDPDLKRLQEKTTAFLKNFTYEDEKGVHFNLDLVQQIRQLVMPLFISQLDNIRVPAIQGSNEDYDYVFDNIIFSGRDIMPEMVEVHTRSDFKFNMKNLEADQARSFALIQVSHIKPKFTDISFQFNRKTFPQMEDHGKANVSAVGEGITLRIVIELFEKDNAPSFSLRRVDVDIDSIQIDLLSSQHQFLTGLFTTLYEVKIKEMIQQNVAMKIREVFETIQAGVNDLFTRYPPSKIKDAISQHPTEILQAIQS